MLLTIDSEDRRPLYQQIIDEVKKLIARGDLREGMMLPPVRQVAENLGVNLNTIAVAYRQLQDEGLVKVRHGSGAIVSFQRPRREDRDEACKHLRTALTEMTLSGFEAREIVSIVQDELKSLRLKGGRQ